MSGRALSFGVMAQAYERFRPGYPVELFAEVMAYAGQPARTALEIGAADRSNWPTRLWRELFARHGHRSWRATRFRPRTGRLPGTTCSGRVRSCNGPNGSPAFNSP